ncbi:MAG: hypothetical protein O7J95_02070 [Planctomycetota bacterium]|nr:hypothetical protein [Planctomycetota bacterium]
MADPIWCPTRGYFTIGEGGGGAPAGGKEEATPPAEEAEKATSPAAAPAAPKTPAVQAAQKAPPKPAVARAAAKPKGDAKPAAPKKPAAPDPERESITTIPGLLEGSAFSGVKERFYDAADSETTLYRVPTLNVVFALSSAALLFWTCLVLWQDYDREWKHIRKDWNRELVEEYRQGLWEVSAARFPELAALELRLTEMMRSFKAPVPSLTAVPGDVVQDGETILDHQRFRAQAMRIDELIAVVYDQLGDDSEFVKRREELSEAENFHDTADRKLRFRRGDLQEKKSDDRDAKGNALEDLSGGKRTDAFTAISREYAKWYPEIDALVRKEETTKVAAEEALGAYEAHVKLRTSAGGTDLLDVEKQLATLRLAVQGEEKKIAEVEDSLRNALRDGLLIEAFNPVLTIEKVVLTDLTEDLNFLHQRRVDRCKTCHINIDSPDPSLADHHSDRWGSVYASHPRPDLYLDGTSPHPYESFGCTSCHYGDGWMTDFRLAAHTPSDEHEALVWESKYDWEELHHNDFPMHAMQHTTSSCRKCHDRQDVVDGGGALNLGLEIVRTYGCFGCHRIDGFEVLLGDAATPDDIWKRNKVGPSLRYIKDKASPDFLYRWIKNPWHFRPSSRMPRFFDLANNSGKMLVQRSTRARPVEELDLSERGKVEALALATYVHETSDSRADKFRHPGIEGDPVRGRELVQKLACVGCHSIKTERVKGGGASPLPTPAAVAAVQDGLERAAALAETATGAEKPDAVALAANYREVGESLVAMRKWFKKLTIDRTVEDLVHAVRAPLVRAAKLEERLEIDESALDEARQLSDALFDRSVHSTFAPDLSAIGSKFALLGDRRQAEAWLHDWITNPAGHDPESVMPRLRLEAGSDPEGPAKVADIVAYLLTLRDEEFERAETLSEETLTEEQTKILQDVVFTNLRARHLATKAKDLLDGMSVGQRLVYAGYRLVQRYGCFGCHNGIRKDDPDPAAARAPGTNGEGPVKYFDAAQPIGTELNGWGNKPANRLDFGPWGHQVDGHEAIPHRRTDWLTAKLQSTRRFDVYPEKGSEDTVKDKHHYVLPEDPSEAKIIAKTPEELLKMPLFPFHDNPEMVDAAMTFITSLVNDKIPLSKKRRFDPRDDLIERGSRVIRKYNCAGCHRIGVDSVTLSLDELPTFLSRDDEDTRRTELEKETWLGADFTIRRPKAAGEVAELELPAGTLLNRIVLDPTIEPRSELAESEEESGVELAKRHFDPRPHFIQQVVRCLKRDVDEALVDTGILGFVRQMTGDGADESPLKAFLERVRKAAYEDTKGHVWRLSLKFYDPDYSGPYSRESRAWLKTPLSGVRQWKELAKAYFGGPLKRVPPEQQRLAVRGLGEGRIRYYFDPEVSADARTNAPPPLVRQGERVHGDWLFRFLLDVQPLRLQLEVRMPSFKLTHEEARAIVAWFRAVSEVPQTSEYFDAADTYRPDEARAGQKLFHEAFQCLNCHPTSTTLPTVEKVSWGPDLSLAARRLRPPWLRDWLVQPFDFMPGTKMSAFFGQRDYYYGRADSHIEPGAEEQIRQLIQFMVHMEKVPAVQPDGSGGN